MGLFVAAECELSRIDIRFSALTTHNSAPQTKTSFSGSPLRTIHPGQAEIGCGRSLLRSVSSPTSISAFPPSQFTLPPLRRKFDFQPSLVRELSGTGRNGLELLAAPEREFPRVDICFSAPDNPLLPPRAKHSFPGSHPRPIPLQQLKTGCHRLLLQNPSSPAPIFAFPPSWFTFLLTTRNALFPGTLSCLIHLRQPDICLGCLLLRKVSSPA